MPRRRRRPPFSRNFQPFSRRALTGRPRQWRDPRKPFYAGLTPTLAGIIPYSVRQPLRAPDEPIKSDKRTSTLTPPPPRPQGTTWATYETLRERMLRARGLPADADLPPLLTAVAGGLAGILGQTVAYPCDVVRRRMQTAVLAPGLARAPSMAAVFGELLRTEGVKGMYKGLSVNYFKAPVAMGISFSLYARVKQGLEQWEDALEAKERRAALEAAVAGGRTLPQARGPGAAVAAGRGRGQ